MPHIIHTNESMATFIDISPDDLDALCQEKEASPDELFAKLVHRESEHVTTVKVIDDCGDERPYRHNQWYLMGHEFGPTHLIRARNDGEAYEIWLDEQETIAPDEVHEAHGAYDKLRAWLIARGHEDTIELRHFANRWDETFFKLSIADTTNDNRWDEWPLIEGYEMQSNSSGTGIVNVGHYAWQRTLVQCPEYIVKLSGKVS